MKETTTAPHQKQITLFHAYWQLAVGTGRPEQLIVRQAELPPWETNAELLPFAASNVAIVGSFPTENDAYAAGDALVFRDENNFYQWV